MAKLIYSEDFKIRFTNAAKNGSKVCRDIMKAINIPNNIKDGVSWNYLTTVRVRQGTYDPFIKKSVKVTVCTKDFSNANNPEHGSPVGMWRRENRTDIALTRLVEAFKSLNPTDYTSDDYKYAASILCVEEPLKCGIYSKMQDIERGYNGANYIDTFSGDGTLQHSCMRGEDTAAVAGDFYANFAGANIILVTGTASGKVYGRAMLWPSITLHEDGEAVTGPFLERVYFAHDAILDMVRDFALSKGVRFRKWKNTFSDKRTFVDMTNDRLIEEATYISVPVKKWHKHGSPYLDTFSYLFYKDGQFFLGNRSMDKDGHDCVADLATTGTTAAKYKSICPVCGHVHSNEPGLCTSCRRALIKTTPVGNVYIGKMNKNHEPILPKKFVEDAKHLMSI